MSKAIVDRDQAIQALMTLGTKVNWDEVPPDVLQEVIDDKDGRTGPEFTAFLKNRGKLIIREPKIVNIDRSVAFNPARFIGEGWGFDKQDKNAVAITELDITKVLLVDMLKAGESSVSGEEKQKRLAKAGNICLDAGAFWHFWKNKHLIPVSWKEPINGSIQFIYFNGTRLRSPRGVRCVLCLSWHSGQWHWSFGWLGDRFHACSRSAVLAA